MIGRRAVIGLSLLSMLVFCAVAAPSAFATKGTTGFTCVKVAEKAEFEDAHCTKAGTGPGYVHQAIKPGAEKTITVSNKNTANGTTEHTPALLTAEPVAGNSVVITCTTVHGSGTETNNEGPPMNVSGTVTVEFSECTGTLNGKACESINEGKAIQIKASISSPSEAMEIKLDEDGGPFANFSVKCAKTNFSITLEGSATNIPNGTTAEFTKASTSGLKCGGKGASFEGKVTATPSTTEFGIALTTTAT